MTWDELVTIEPRLARVAAQARIAGVRLRIANADATEMAVGWRRFLIMAATEFLGPDVDGGIPPSLFASGALFAVYEHLRAVFRGDVQDGVDEFEELRQKVVEKLNSGHFMDDDPDIAAYRIHISAAHGMV